MTAVEVSLLVLARLLVLQNYGFVAQARKRIRKNKISADISSDDNDC
jgi:hypothetical protein